MRLNPFKRAPQQEPLMSEVYTFLNPDCAPIRVIDVVLYGSVKVFPLDRWQIDLDQLEQPRPVRGEIDVYNEIAGWVEDNVCYKRGMYSHTIRNDNSRWAMLNELMPIVPY